MNLMKKQTVTIEHLAQMVQKGFNHVDEQFKHVDERFEHVDERFNRIDRDLKAIHKELADVVHRREFDRLEERVKEVENLLAMPDKKAA